MGRTTYFKGILVERSALHRMAEKEGGELYVAYQKWISGRDSSKNLILCMSTPQGMGTDQVSNEFPLLTIRLENSDMLMAMALGDALERKVRAKGVLAKLRAKYPRFKFSNTYAR